ncbi:hypothetical protein FQN60_001047, partial [Etheostoma spectabile]
MCECVSHVLPGLIRRCITGRVVRVNSTDCFIPVASLRRGIKGYKSKMCDHREKGHKHGKTSNSKSQPMKHHRQSQGHRHRQKLHQSDDNESNDTHSTAEDSLFSDHPPDHQHQRADDKTHHSYHRKQNLHHTCLSETPHSSSTGSSSSSSSSLSSSSTSSASSTPSSSSSSSSSSSFSSSFSSSSSTSSSSLASEASRECLDKYPLKKPPHSLSCNDISKENLYFEEEDDTAPLIHKR